MSCCGQTAQQALAAAQQTLDARTAALTHVQLVYTGQDKRVRPFVAAGKVYQFGNNERRRTNVVAQAALIQLLATGLFAVFDPERHNEDGSAKLTTSGTLKEEQGASFGFAQDKRGKGQGTSMSDPVSLVQPGATDAAGDEATEAPQTVSEAVAGENPTGTGAAPSLAPSAPASGTTKKKGR